MEQRGAGNQGASAVLDAATLRRVRDRDAEALGRFFDCFYDRIFGHVAHMVGNATLAEDLTQDAFLRMHRGIDRLDPERDPTAWVFTVTTNTVRDHWRSKEHRSGQRRSDLDPEHDLNLPADEPGVQEEMEREEAARAVRAALQQLSPEDREVILLRSYEDLNSPEVGEILGLSPEAVRQRHRRAVGRLGDSLKRADKNERGEA